MVLWRDGLALAWLTSGQSAPLARGSVALAVTRIASPLANVLGVDAARSTVAAANIDVQLSRHSRADAPRHAAPTPAVP